MIEFLPMREDHLNAVLAIEILAHPSPWTRGNFKDSMRGGHTAVLMQEEAAVLGYAVLMPLPEEAELLNITVAPARQRGGLGRQLLEHVCALAQEQGAQRMFLEVRASNLPARTLYGHSGFSEVGLRRGYYAAAPGSENAREDAILMAREL